MFKKGHTIKVHWDGITDARVTDVNHDDVTIQRIVPIKGGTIPFGDSITVKSHELAQMARD